MDINLSTLTIMDILDLALPFARAILLLAAGWLLAGWVKRLVINSKSRLLKPKTKPILALISFYGILLLTLLSSISILGFNISVLLGAAGVLTIAAGFASQTAASNIVSGIFLMMENPFSVGDVITINTTTGEVVAIELLSTRLRTFDNLYVRIPNETMLKSNVTNLTRFDTRRFDLIVEVAYKEDLDTVTDTLFAIADTQDIVLKDPAPIYIILEFASSGVKIQFSFWAQRVDFLLARNTMFKAIHRTFAEKGIEIPFPHLSLYTGEATKPFPVHTLDSKGKKAA
jgi:small-conductance mechanosensitive channel